MASVESRETRITVKQVARSFCGWAGRAADRARAADAPQMAVAPPLRRPKRGLKPNSLASPIETAMVRTRAAAAMAIGSQPRPTIWSRVIRAPSRATPRRRTLFEAKSMPGRLRSSAPRKFIAMPSNRASSITGAL